MIILKLNQKPADDRPHDCVVFSCQSLFEIIFHFSTHKEAHLKARLMRVKANAKNLKQKV